jgi:SAM-dependent methyltransferase
MAHNADDKEKLTNDAQTIKNKLFLRYIYTDFYKSMAPKNIPSGSIVELGSGEGFIKEIVPRAITSDIISSHGIDKVFSAEKIPYKTSSIAAFLMVDVLHHIKNPEKALKEMERCLKPQGKIIMIEPYNSLWGGFVYKYLHHEHFDPKGNWQIKGKNRMSDSNTALPWIIFVRDRNMFEKKFPDLKIIKLLPHTPFTYLISGGLTKFQFLPNFTYPIVKFVEMLMAPLNRWLGMFITIEIQKRMV